LGWASLEGAFYWKGRDNKKCKPSWNCASAFGGGHPRTCGMRANGRHRNYWLIRMVSGGKIGRLSADPHLASNKRSFSAGATDCGCLVQFASKKETVTGRESVCYYGCGYPEVTPCAQNGPSISGFRPSKNICVIGDCAPNAAYPGAKVIPAGCRRQPENSDRGVLKPEGGEQQFLQGFVVFSYIVSQVPRYFGAANLPTPKICPATPCPAGYRPRAYYYPGRRGAGQKRGVDKTHSFSQASVDHGLEVE